MHGHILRTVITVLKQGYWCRLELKERFSRRGAGPMSFATRHWFIRTVTRHVAKFATAKTLSAFHQIIRMTTSVFVSSLCLERRLLVRERFLGRLTWLKEARFLSCFAEALTLLLLKDLLVAANSSGLELSTNLTVSAGKGNEKQCLIFCVLFIRIYRDQDSVALIDQWCTIVVVACLVIDLILTIFPFDVRRSLRAICVHREEVFHGLRQHRDRRCLFCTMALLGRERRDRRV